MTATKTDMLDLTYVPDCRGNIGDWKGRHLSAVKAPRNFETPIIGLLRSWLTYAALHEMRYESGIGEDGVLGDAWRDTGLAIHKLLDGDCGRLDCGTLSTIIHHNLAVQGFKEGE